MRRPLSLGIGVVLCMVVTVLVLAFSTATGLESSASQAAAADVHGIGSRIQASNAFAKQMSRAPAHPVAFGGGQVQLDGTGSDISEEQRQEIEAEVQRSIRALRLQGGIRNLGSVEKVLLSWPLRAASGFADYGYHSLCSFVDHDPDSPDHLLDYNCGTRTHDRAGWNHSGTDFCLWPFRWLKMDRKEVEVVAAAGGVIVAKEDGNFDRHCGELTGRENFVTVMHDDGSIAYYYHFKNGSVTTKRVGDYVVTGEYLGVPGSSGPSGGPHLHFEVHDAIGQVIDPYQGPCNDLNPDSWWISQPPYYDSAINKLSTGIAPPIFPPCPEDEIPNERWAFGPGATIYFVAYYRDQLFGQQSLYTIYQPDGSLYLSWSHSSDQPYYEASYWYWAWVFPADVPRGTWRFEIVYEGQVYERSFVIAEFDNYVFLPLVRQQAAN